MGASKTRTVGGGKARPVADRFNKMLLEGLDNGMFEDSIYNLFSGADNPLTTPAPVDMNDPQFAAAGRLFDQERTRSVADLRSRYGAEGGAPRGSAAMTAEALYASDADARKVLGMNDIANTIREQNRADRAITSQELMFQGNRELSVLANLFDSYRQANSLGTAQAQIVQQPSDFSQALGAVAGLAPFALAPFTGGASLGLSFGNRGNAGGYTTPQFNPNMLTRRSSTSITPAPLTFR